MKKAILILVAGAALALSRQNTSAVPISFDPGTPSDSANPGGLMSTPGTVAIGEVATYVSGGNGVFGIATCWTAGSACDPGPTPGSAAAAASAIDHYWLQYDPGITFSFSSPTSSVVAVAGIDHLFAGEAPGEALEFRVFGVGATGLEEGAIVAVYDLGVDGGLGPLISSPSQGGAMFAGDSDNWSSLWQFTSSYSTFLVTSGDHIAGFISAGEGEIDGLAKPAPEPGTLLLLAAGFAAAAGFRRRKNA